MELRFLNRKRIRKELSKPPPQSSPYPGGGGRDPHLSPPLTKGEVSSLRVERSRLPPLVTSTGVERSRIPLSLRKREMSKGQRDLHFGFESGKSPLFPLFQRGRRAKKAFLFKGGDPDSPLPEKSETWRMPGESWRGI